MGPSGSGKSTLLNLISLIDTPSSGFVKINNDEIIIGITDYAQHELGDIVFVELPSVGETFSENDTIGTIEAVKTVADIYCPVDGEVVELNTEIEDASRMDGASERSVFFGVCIPQVKAGLAATSVFALILTWNEFLFSLLLTNKLTRTMPPAMAN